MLLLKQSLLLTLGLLVLCCGVYPALVLGLAQLAPNHGRGQIVSAHGRVVGFARVGQSFTRPEYFWGRPSAVAYNAAGSGGSNQAPSNPAYQATVRARLDTFLLRHPGVRATQVPAELLTASGSGLDPDLSPQGALVQAGRVARARHLPEARVRQLVEAHTEIALLGPTHVNVLRLNVALDELRP